MVAVRKSHQMTQANFAQWLETLEINQSKSDALQSTWHALKPLFEQEPQCQLKALEMVEILAALNLDKESLIAAMLSPLVEYQLISRDQVVEDYPKVFIHLLPALSKWMRLSRCNKVLIAKSRLIR